MKFPRSLLVVITESHEQDAALVRAMKFAQQGNMSMHLLSAAYEPLTELTEVLTSEQIMDLRAQCLSQKEAQLVKLSSEVQSQGIRCDHSVLWNKRLADAIEYSVEHLTPDLVIKQVATGADIPHPLAMPDERHLLRYCQAPLLLVRSALWKAGPILAAVDPTNPEPVHQSLDHSVLRCARMLAELIRCDWHVGSVSVSASGCEVCSALAQHKDQLSQQIKQWHSEKLAQLMLEYPNKAQHVHLAAGEPQVQIPKLAQQLNAQLLVIGTIGRCGLQEAYIGNTAEHILARLDCDVLALQPDQLAHADALL